MIFYLFPGGGGSRMGTGSRKSSHHQRSGSNPINPSSSNSIPSHASAVSGTSEDYVDMSPAGSGSGSRPGAVPIPNRNMSSTSLTFGTSPSAGMLADSEFFKNFLYQDGVKSTVFWVFEDLKFKRAIFQIFW